MTSLLSYQDKLDLATYYLEPKRTTQVGLNRGLDALFYSLDFYGARVLSLKDAFLDYYKELDEQDKAYGATFTILKLTQVFADHSHQDPEDIFVNEVLKIDNSSSTRRKILAKEFVNKSIQTLRAQEYVRLIGEYEKKHDVFSHEDLRYFRTCSEKLIVKVLERISV